MRGARHHPAVRRFRAIPDASVRGFRERVAGEVVVPGDDDYDAARRVWNGLINRYPAAIVRCTGVADVIETVRFAREHDLPVSVRGGGHNVAGTAVTDGGVVVDCSPMRGIHVDPDARRVRVQPGVRLGELLRETQVFGLATPGGMASDTGVAGSTLGGGIGWLRRKHGLGIDDLVSVDVVTADGEVLTASETEHPDLFWAIRGGGATLGVVTSFEMALHPVGPEVATATVFYPGESAADVLRAYREFAATAPDEVTTIAFLSSTVDHPAIPEGTHHDLSLGVMACYAGPVEAGEAALAPLRDLADVRPLSDQSEVTTFEKLHDADDVYPHGRHYYWKSLYLDELDDDAIAALVDHAERSPSHLSSLTLWGFGGAMSRVPADATAFAGRDAAFMLTVEASWEDAEETAENVAWARETWTTLREHAPGGLYVNFPGLREEGRDLVRAACGDNYDRLVAVCERYDPDGLFALNRDLLADGSRTSAGS